MLECGANYKGTLNENCNVCNRIDDEYHRLNDCTKYSNINFCGSDNKVDFSKIYSGDIDILRELIPTIEKVWNTKCAHGSMNSI